MLTVFANCFKIPELRQRILFTLVVVVIVRIGAFIPCPGVNTDILALYFKTVVDTQSNSVVGMFNTFTGGAFENCAVFSLNIIPYISASIAMQMLTAIIPQLSKLSREDGGRQKVTQYTRYVAICICIFQGFLIARQFETPESGNLFNKIGPIIAQYGPLVTNPGLLFEFTTVLSLTTGTMILMWLGEQITDKGIGNGISLIITISIVSRLPLGLAQGWDMLVGADGKSGTPILIVPVLLSLFLVIACTIAITVAVRKVVVSYAQRLRGAQMSKSTSFIPLKVNYASTMPIIFAQSMIMIPQLLLTTLPLSNTPFLRDLIESTLHGTMYYLIFVGMIFFFSYFWVATTFNPLEISENLKNNNGLVPGYRPGSHTADFLESTMNKLTLAGCIFLSVLAVIPHLAAEYLQVPYNTASFFGGTSLLITIGVMLDTLRQLETHQLNTNYDVFLKRAKRQRGPETAVMPANAVAQSGLVWLYFTIALFLILGAVAAARH
jgi:preprotein translocase subunit SecY